MENVSDRRAAVDVVVPFVGTQAELAELVERLANLALVAGDTVTIVDNRPGAAPAIRSHGALRTIRAPELPSSYFARNRGAAAGTNRWLVFLDADVEPPASLIDGYFATAPVAQTAVLAGAVVDEPVDDGRRSPIAARYATASSSMSQRNTLRGAWAYAQTANCAIRRDAFEQVGGFNEHVRSGGDADICFRLRAAGWELEHRADAAVIHRSRRTMRALVRQKARHGSGAAWLDREYPGSFPRARSLGLAKWTAQSFARAAEAGLRGRGDEAIVAAVEPLAKWAFELGRAFPNEVGRR